MARIRLRAQENAENSYRPTITRNLNGIFLIFYYAVARAERQTRAHAKQQVVRNTIFFFPRKYWPRTKGGGKQIQQRGGVVQGGNQ